MSTAMGRAFAVALAAASVTRGAAMNMNPIADPAAIVEIGQARFTVLTPQLIRMEWSATGQFEDRASQAIVNRDLPVPAFQVYHKEEFLVIRTDKLILWYERDSGRFTERNLHIDMRVAGQKFVWRPGMPGAGNLLGTARTLDGVSGSCPLEPGLVSRDGWVLHDESDALVFADGDPPWMTRRTDRDAIDWYFFGHAHDYPQALADWIAVAGRIPLPPRYAFGTWWSRYWAYTADDLRALVDGFDKHDVPLDVLVIDMDWHLDGWTGYTWNPAYFPEPAAFLQWTHEQGLRTTLNLHPADGVGRHEAAFEATCARLGLDPATTDRIPFDCTDRAYMQAYFELLHHPLELQGVDFWWIDWQQGGNSSMPGLDPLWWLNHLHWQDHAQRATATGQRPLIFSRWGGLGNHRYPIGFSGDTFCNWASLAFQPYFTATAGNVGFAYWSHDIGGHQPGPVDPELYTRWIQFGAFSPVLRTHTTKNRAAERRIWAFPEPYFDAMRSAFHLRYELLPYIYTAARECYDTGLPLCRPLYYNWPERDEAYACRNAYLFGNDLLVAPITRPAGKLTGSAQATVWIPPGQWTHWFTGRTVTGPQTIVTNAQLDQLPVWSRAGSVIPLQRPGRRAAATLAEPLRVQLFAGKEGLCDLYEDDGLSSAYGADAFSRTAIHQRALPTGRAITIGSARGTFAGQPDERAWELHLRNVLADVAATTVTLNGVPIAHRLTAGEEVGWWYEPRLCTLIVRTPRTSVRAPATVVVDFGEVAGVVQERADGLAGRLDAIADVADALADHDPDARTKVAAAVATLARPGAVQTGLDDVTDRWTDAVGRVLAAPLPAEQRQHAFSRLLDLGIQTRVLPVDDGHVRMTIDVSVGDGAAAARLGTVQLGLRLDTPPGWVMTRRPAMNQVMSQFDAPASFVAEFRPPRPADTTRLRGSLSIDVGGYDLPFAIDETVLPSINRWWVAGPFDAPASTRLQRAFSPETEYLATFAGAAAVRQTPFPVDPSARYPGKRDHPARWVAAERDWNRGDLADEHFVEFHKVFDQLEYNAIAYGFVYLIAPEAMDVELVIGSDDGFVVWLNGVEVARKDVGRPYLSREDRVPLSLSAGPNPLLVKISQGSGMWSFAAHVETADRQPVTQVHARRTLD